MTSISTKTPASPTPDNVLAVLRDLKFNDDVREGRTPRKDVRFVALGELDASAFTGMATGADHLTGHVADGSVIANISGGSAAPIANSLSAIMDHDIGNVSAEISIRNDTIWTAVGVTGDISLSKLGVTVVSKVHGVSYGASPSTNTVPVVTGANTVTYEAVPNTALANSSMTIAGHSIALGGTQAIAASDLSNGVSGSGAVALVSGPTFGNITATGTVALATGGAAGDTVYIGGATQSGANPGEMVFPNAKSIRWRKADDSTTTGAISVDSSDILNVGTTNGTKFIGQITSTVATGSAPFVVASTTQVANLNAATSGLASTATALATARTIGGTSFDGTANITVATATGGFTVSGGALALGANDLTMTGSLGATGARLTKGWFTDLQVTNAIAGSVSGNAATVTTNANLTGPITSLGNATSIASQTGTGTKFVMDASPTIASPTINSAASVGGTWTAAATWTLPAFTLGGTVTAGGNSISNAGDSGFGVASSATYRVNAKGTSTANSAYVFYGQDSAGLLLFHVRNDGYFVTGTGAQSPYNSTAAVSANCFINTDGGLYRATSALKYKRDVRDLEDIDISAFRPVRYKSKAKIDGDREFIGFISDELNAAGRHEFVQYGAYGEVEGLSYDRITAVLMQKVQSLLPRLSAIESTMGIAPPSIFTAGGIRAENRQLH